MKTPKQKKTSLRQIIIIAVAALLVITTGWITFAYTAKQWPFVNSTKENNTQELLDQKPVNTVDLTPPTNQDLQDGQAAKDRLDESNKEQPDNNNSNSQSTEKREATVGVSKASISGKDLEIRAFTTSVIEGDGTCTAVLTKEGQKEVTKKSSAFIDASSTICEPILIPSSQFAKGTWTLEVTYSSSKYKGSSGPIEVEIR